MNPDDSDLNQLTTEAPQPAADKAEAAKKPQSRLKRLLNPYLIGIIVLIIAGLGLTYYVYQQRQSTINIDGSDVPSSSLSEADFARLAAGQAEIDSTNKTLNVGANSVFDGTMLVKSSLDVQGQLRVGQELTLNDLSVAGQGTVNNLDIASDLNVQGESQFSGATSMQGSLSVSGNFSTTGSGTFAGNLTANVIEAGNLSFSGDLRLGGHIITSGEQTRASSGNSIGSGGTVSVSGNDTAGSVAINTGGGPTAGVLINVQFGRSFGTTPRVNITPVGPASGSLDWYVIRSASGFSIGTSSVPSAGNNYSFDYFIVQ